jgi:ribose transport system substrate-binding protein
MNISNARMVASALACAAAAGSLLACGSGSSGGTTAAAGGTSTPSATPVAAKPASPLVADLPAELKAQYVGLPTPPQKSGYAAFKAVKKPWKVCYAESFVGNPWRVAMANEMKRLAGQYQQAGLISGFTMSVADTDVARQNQQIRQFTDQGCSVIFTVAASATGVNAAIKAAHDKGIPVVTLIGSVTSPDALNVDSNYFVMGTALAKATAAASKNVLMVKGIDGSPISVQQNKGAKEEWSQDGTKIVAEVNGNWTPSVTKQAVLNALATHPGDIGAVWTTGSESAVVAQAFKQAGRKPPLITASISGDALGYWKQNPSEFKFSGVGLMPSWAAQTAWRVGMRTLAGDGPKLNPIMVPIPTVSQGELPTLYQSCMKPDSAAVFPVAPQDPLPGNLMDAYFTQKGEAGPFDYASTPGACAGS